MGGQCEAVGCTNHSMKKGTKVSFYRFPKNPDRRKRWANALKKLKRDGSEWTPLKNARICAEHFINGKPNHRDPNHPDYVPSIFKHKRGDKAEKKMARYRAAKRRRLQSESAAKVKPANIDVSSSHGDLKSKTLPEIDSHTNEDLISPVETPSNLSVTPDSHVASLAAPVTAREEMLYDEINALRAERDAALEKLKETEERLGKSYFTAGSVCEDDIKCKSCTGLSWNAFITTFNFLSNFVQVKKPALSPVDQFFLTLVKMRTGLTFEFLATQTNVSKGTVIRIFWKWTDVMYINLAFLIRHPDMEAVRATLPPVFKRLYPRLTCIVDCFEIFIDQPKTLKARAQTYSNYKKHNTIKVFIGCTPLGAISFVSKAWGGRVSDVELIRRCGFINSNLHAPGDQILADRGFRVQEDFAIQCGAEFIIPAFTKGKNQLSAKEVEVSRQLASVRIHIERVIGVLKNRYHILNDPLSINLIKSMKDEAMGAPVAKIDKIITACAALVNLGDGIVYDTDKHTK